MKDIKSLLMIGLLSSSLMVGCNNKKIENIELQDTTTETTDLIEEKEETEKENAIRRYNSSIGRSENNITQEELEELVRYETENLVELFGNPKYEIGDDFVSFTFIIDKEIMEDYTTNNTESALRLCQYLKDSLELKGEDVSVWVQFNDPNYEVGKVEFVACIRKGSDEVIFFDTVNNIDYRDTEELWEILDNN